MAVCILCCVDVRSKPVVSGLWCYHLGEGVEAAGVFYGCSSTDNLFLGTLLALLNDIINPPTTISSDQPEVGIKDIPGR